MAQFIMLPDGDLLQQWDSSGGGTSSYTDVDDDNGDTQYAFSNTTGERIIVELATPSVASEDVDTVNSVTIKASVKKYSIGTSYLILQQRGIAADSSSISNGSDTITIASSLTYSTISGTAETTSDGSDAWVYGDLAGLQIRLDKYRNDRFGELRVSYLYAEVDYTEAAAAADNATFFGANF